MENKIEFANRINRLKSMMKRDRIDVCLVYGDEYRRENLRYLTNIWPIFERGAVIISTEGEPIVLGAPEGEVYCREMSAWQDIRLVPEFECVTVPDDIDYPYAHYITFKDLFSELRRKEQIKRVGICGLDAMNAILYEIIKKEIGEAEIVDVAYMLYDLRIVKSSYEIACLRRAIEIADLGYLELLRAAQSGVTELDLAGAAIGAVMKNGAEYAPFCLVSSGDRVNTIVGRATNKVIEDGDMVMAALAVQYEGYIATFNFPFVVGKASCRQKIFITNLVKAYQIALANLKAGVPQNNLISAVKKYFKEKGLEQYDLYPSLHGCGLSEAESPYPNETTTALFKENMAVNTDISIFGHPDGSNRIEAGFIVTKDGYESPSKLVRNLLDAWQNEQDYQSVLK